MGNIVAIGPREQDFELTNNFFSRSITLYGHNNGQNISYCGSRKIRINHNVSTQDQSDFIENEMIRMIRQDPAVRFMSYDPSLAYSCSQEIVEHTVCLNNQSLLELLNHKIQFRQWASKIPGCVVFCSKLLQGRECSLKGLHNTFGRSGPYVIQQDVASGGEGTLLLDKENEKNVAEVIDPEEYYLVSLFEQNNIPINVHAVIYSDGILLAPVSIQIMQSNGNKILYHGADFVAVDQINHASLEEFEKSVLAVCRSLQADGYRGIIGIDGMITGGRAYLMEANGRFQGSTPLLNMALHDAGLPSMQELNYEAFIQCRPSISNDALRSIRVPYSCYTYLATDDGKVPFGHCRDFYLDANVIKVYSDGLHYDMPIVPVASLERVVFSTNIVSVTSTDAVRLHPNIPDVDLKWAHKIIREKDPLYIKIALVNQGVRITEAAEDYLRNHGGMREGVYNAVDITIGNIVINSAVRVKFAKLSPFYIDTSENQLLLYYCGEKISNISIPSADTLLDITLSNTAKVGDICLLATDRIRIQHSTNCYFKRCGVGCKFCEVENVEYGFKGDDIFRAIDTYIGSNYEFRHFLIGGRSDSPSREPQEILNIIKYIRSRGSWPIYIMCVPPQDLCILDRWKEAGATEISMNIEIWNPQLAKEWMPGKGIVLRQQYIEALSYAASLWGNSGDVRSAFVVGLEPAESLLEGVEEVCKVGAAPILSVFRPIPKTEGDRIVPPDNMWLFEIYQRASNICQKYGLALGPTCVPCQNNTLSMPQGFTI